MVFQLAALVALSALPSLVDGGSAFSATGEVDAGELVFVDDVTVIAPPTQTPRSTSPLVRDPSALSSTRDARDAIAEAKDASDLVATVPGAVVLDSGGPGQRKTLSLRGAAPNAVTVLLDGVPLSSTGSALDLSRIPTAALERIEVLRGTGSRYGPGAMGGVVNLVTRSVEGHSSLFGDVSQGSFVTTRLMAGGRTGVLGGDGLLLLHGLRTEGTFNYRYDAQPSLEGNALTTLTRTNNDALSGGGLLRWRRQLGGTQLDATGEGLFEERGLAGPVQNPSNTARQQTARGTLSVRTHTSFDAGGSLASLASVRLDDSVLSGSFLGGGRYHQLESAAGGELVFTRLFATRHLLTALVTGGGDWLAGPGDVRPSQGRVGAMLGEQLLLFDGAASVHASARVDVAGRFVVVSPKLGVTAELPKGFFVKANVGQASRPPSFTELYLVQGTLLPNPDLRPERALNVDGSVGWKHEKLELSVGGFGALYEDLISYEYSPPNLARPYNFQAARVAGVEVEVSARPFSWLEASGAYTWLDTQNLRDDPRYYLKSLPFRPRHRMHARIAGGVDWLKGHVEVLYQSAQFTNRTETLTLPERALVSAGVTVVPWKSPRLSVSAELKNILDVQTQDLDGYPLPPRAFFVTAGFQWDPS